jgi:PIN domain nuclease of toxin-antitoxin system
MTAGVADTHAALWYLLKSPLLSPAARRFMDEAAEKGRLPSSAYEDLKNALADPDYVIEEGPFTAEVSDAMRRLARADVPDMPDRIVTATALYLGVPIISRDGHIRSLISGQSGKRAGGLMGSRSLTLATQFGAAT